MGVIGYGVEAGTGFEPAMIGVTNTPVQGTRFRPLSHPAFPSDTTVPGKPCLALDTQTGGKSE